MFYSLSENKVTDEYVCALVRELQVNQSHQKLEWVQLLMSDFVRGAETVVSLTYLYTEILGRTSMHDDSCKVVLYTFGTI